MGAPPEQQHPVAGGVLVDEHITALQEIVSRSGATILPR
jgi:hypothetical protein